MTKSPGTLGMIYLQVVGRVVRFWNTLTYSLTSKLKYLGIIRRRPRARHSPASAASMLLYVPGTLGTVQRYQVPGT